MSRQIDDVIEHFVREYLIDLDKVRAYRAVRPDVLDSTVHSASTRFLRRADVQAKLAEVSAEMFGPLRIDAERVAQELAALGFANMADYVRVQSDGSAALDLSQLTERQLSAIQEFVVDEYVDGKGEAARPVKRMRVKRMRLKLYDKGQNLERLGRYLKMFTDKVEVSGLEQLAERVRQAREHSDLTG